MIIGAVASGATSLLEWGMDLCGDISMESVHFSQNKLPIS